MPGPLLWRPTAHGRKARHRGLSNISHPMSESRSNGIERRNLGFEECVQSTFAFLATYGFSLVRSDDFAAYYVSDCARLVIRHDRLSYELSFELARTDDRYELVHPYSLQDLIRAIDSDSARRYRDFAATSHDATARGIQELADNVKKFGDGALRAPNRMIVGVVGGR
jgi:hypothetical protein